MEHNASTRDFLRVKKEYNGLKREKGLLKWKRKISKKFFGAEC